MPDFLTLILNIDQFMQLWVAQYGAWIYLLLFLIVFGETGLVILPFLPGDSLLFIAGAFGANGLIHPFWLAVLLIVAAVLGNTLNYAIGRAIGPKVFSTHYRLLDQRALLATRAFYEKHGGKTIVLARFLPVLRTFAPFVAGVGGMRWGRFQFFNIAGALLWVGGLITLGFFFGNVPVIKEHLNVIVLLGVSVAVVPVALAGVYRLLVRRKPA